MSRFTITINKYSPEIFSPFLCSTSIPFLLLHILVQLQTGFHSLSHTRLIIVDLFCFMLDGPGFMMLVISLLSGFGAGAVIEAYRFSTISAYTKLLYILPSVCAVSQFPFTNLGVKFLFYMNIQFHVNPPSTECTPAVTWIPFSLTIRTTIFQRFIIPWRFFWCLDPSLQLVINPAHVFGVDVYRFSNISAHTKLLCLDIMKFQCPTFPFQQSLSQVISLYSHSSHTLPFLLQGVLQLQTEFYSFSHS